MPLPVPGLGRLPSMEDMAAFLADRMANVRNQAAKTSQNFKETQSVMLREEALQKLMETGMNAGGLGAIKMYHGGPHKFRQFSDAAINSGEGSQMEGWGHYTSDTERVGASYGNMIGYPAVLGPRGETLAHSDWKGGAKKQAYNLLTSAQGNVGDMQAAYDMAKETARTMPMPPDAPRNEVLGYLKEWEAQNAQVGHAGRLYHVDARWPSRVHETIDPLSPEHYLDRVHKVVDQPKVMDALEGSGLLMPGEYDSGRQYYDNLSQELGGEKQASQALFQEAGVPGIKYPDQDFARADNPTNFVNFSDMLLNILRRKKMGWE
jgi:hypothetical protein